MNIRLREGLRAISVVISILFLPASVLNAGEGRCLRSPGEPQRRNDQLGKTQ
jgi:hypothetical protein